MRGGAYVRSGARVEGQGVRARTVRAKRAPRARIRALRVGPDEMGSGRSSGDRDRGPTGDLGAYTVRHEWGPRVRRHLRTGVPIRSPLCSYQETEWATNSTEGRFLPAHMAR
jgi:hypothetical protein